MVATVRPLRTPVLGRLGQRISAFLATTSAAQHYARNLLLDASTRYADLDAAAVAQLAVARRQLADSIAAITATLAPPADDDQASAAGRPARPPPPPPPPPPRRHPGPPPRPAPPAGTSARPPCSRASPTRCPGRPGSAVPGSPCATCNCSTAPWPRPPTGPGSTSPTSTPPRSPGKPESPAGPPPPPAGRPRPLAADRAQVGPLPVVVEDPDDLGRAAGRAEPVRDHRGELGRVPPLDGDRARPQEQHHRARQHGEPVPAGMNPQLVPADLARGPGEPHLGHGHAVRAVLVVQRPGGHAPALVVLRPDHHVVVGRLDQLVDAGPPGPGDRGQLVQADPPVAGLDAAQRGRAQVAPRGQVVQGPAQRQPQPPDPVPDQPVQLAVLRHRQDCMSEPQTSRTVTL